jgi:hypothetical protein
MRIPQKYGKTIFFQIGIQRTISPDYSDGSVRDSRTRALWWNGVPSGRRAIIWYYQATTVLM